MGFSQRDPRWINHTLGFGPALGTIGQYGCVLTTAASIARLAGIDTDPARLDQAFVGAVGPSIFQKDPTGTSDFLPDNSLARLMPDRFEWRGSFRGLRSDLIDKALPSPDVYSELHISTHSVPTHRVYVWSGKNGNYRIDDPWGRPNAKTSVVHALADYGGAAAVTKTILTRFKTPALKPAFHAVRQPANPPAPIPPDPPIPDETEQLYRFVLREGDTSDEPLPPDETTFLSCAETAANDWVADKPRGTVLRVLDADGKRVHQAVAIGIPLTG